MPTPTGGGALVKSGGALAAVAAASAAAAAAPASPTAGGGACACARQAALVPVQLVDPASFPTEALRRAALLATGMVHSPPERRFDAITE